MMVSEDDAAGALGVMVRCAELGDAPALAQVHVAAWRAGYAGLLPAEFLGGLDVSESLSRWEKWLSDESALSVRCLVAVSDDGGVAGMCAVGPARDERHEGIGELRMLNVDPARWGGGFGAALLRRAQSALSEMGYDEAYLWVLEGNDRARRFYSRHGWAATALTRRDEALPSKPVEIQYGRSLP